MGKDVRLKPGVVQIFPHNPGRKLPDIKHNLSKYNILICTQQGGEITSSVVAGKRVLLIEADQAQAEDTRAILRKNGIEPCVAPTIQSAVSQMMIHTFDVVCLDTDTEDAARLIGLLLDLRHAKNTLLLMFPIGDSDIRASFLARGFDMCLSCSAPKECAAAICSLLRRPSVHEYPTKDTPPARILYKDLTIDPLRQKVLMGNAEVTLTTLEFRLLYFLASNPTIVFSREVIYERVWRENSLYGTKSVTDLICSIRKKLGLSSADSAYIKTIKGVGYCFAP